MEDTNDIITSTKLVMDDMIKKDTTPEVKHHMMPGMNKFAKLAQKKKWVLWPVLRYCVHSTPPG